MRVKAGGARTIIVVSWLLAVGGPAWAAKDSVAEGRYHLRKAAALAGDDRCEAAVKEYTLAYQKLHDPVVLFNRAECYRRIRQGASAVADYRAFLLAVPAAPNRAEVEEKIAALAPPSATAPRAVVTPPPPVTPVAADSNSPPAPPPVLATSPAEAPAPVDPAESLASPLAAAPATPPAEDEPEHSHRLWLWAALGVAVAGAAVGAYFVARTPGASPPATQLGNYRF